MYKEFVSKTDLTETLSNTFLKQIIKDNYIKK